MVKPIGVLTAVPQEHAAIERLMTGHAEVAGFTTGQIDGSTVCLGMTGIGKVNAAITATRMCERMSPSMLVFTGVAGGLDPDLDIGDVVIGDLLIQHDAGVLGDDGVEPYQAGHIPFFNPTDEFGFRPSPALLVAVRLAVEERTSAGGPIRFGTILTGDQFVRSEQERERLHRRFSAQAVEMEGGAVAQVAERYGLDHLAIRTLSDRAGGSSPDDFTAFLDQVGRQTAEVFRLLLPAITQV